jgi:hypothetical protein
MKKNGFGKSGLVKHLFVAATKNPKGFTLPFGLWPQFYCNRY